MSWFSTTPELSPLLSKFKMAVPTFSLSVIIDGKAPRTKRINQPELLHCSGSAFRIDDFANDIDSELRF
ncbi:hypothetical protein NDJ22_19850 [Vibrio alginolyticus]|uniref:hypothetical protein n=1 Tax=Vibrio alginolyticus TaxID=663 RepID=UPI0021606D0D|nr:hypothetical protein [Vibrio alginolyticus]MCS0267271.1 hypothetical protein [Vibrio alginolyticus]